MKCVVHDSKGKNVENKAKRATNQAACFYANCVARILSNQYLHCGLRL